jgi:AcrR family transcriptional regulator
MSPRSADPGVRHALVEAAARLIATEGSAGCTLRRLADDVGTSTMAIYTHFGGMDEVRSEVTKEAFARLSGHMGAVEVTDDPVADLCLIGWAYFTNATENPNLYRVMFIERPPSPEATTVALETFEQLVVAVRRCIDSGAFDPGDANSYATQLWGLVHGLVTLELAGLLDAGHGVANLIATVRSLFVGYGMDRADVERSLAAAAERVGGPAATGGGRR